MKFTRKLATAGILALASTSSQAAGSPGVEHRTQAFLEDLAKGGEHRSKPCRLPTHAKCL
ncbi:hypothetical protein LZ757_09160 [Xylella fastidiosa subsp. morus]|uniref:hypothetical protein n=1 Tax=Xylella fastidiosa TaxID=2371 RepID=UPI0003ED19B7|nr:hypothetical protein [Xylella fastidiosa]EWG14488.1 alpha/beta hydrolase domain-containing protein [Xylella fastidiosa Mul-MD]MDC7970781.1 hypothetical protein [Xylella fastidiosa subsp. multiplex]UIN27259.1 hypothetical protein IUD23_08045 [Xylella fastidiosa subsp. morus]UIT36208.1 hypothetical protein LZ757_09160 [Xylella fastidiosa subsp. morus]UIT38501.1 hypothetical protein LZ755_09185 [Xylella fastidiosa subsp. morus]